MARGSSTTRWIIAAAAAVVVVCAAVVVIVVATRSDGPTEPLDPTTVPTTLTTTTVVPTSRDGVTTTEPADVDETRVSIQVGGRDRRYTVVEPRRLGADEQIPVVFVLHGLGVSAEGISRSADWRGAVERDRFLAVFPQGEADSWNMGPCCLPASLVGVDDFGYLDAVVDEVLARPAADDERVYMSGFSNGALMTYAYACRNPGLFVAIAPLAGSNVTDCAPDEPVSLLHQHSDPDRVVPYDGGPSIGHIISAADFPDVPDSVADWAEQAGCDARPDVDEGEDVERFTWDGCPDGVRVELVRIPGRGHVWPTKGDHDPLEAILEFFDIS